MNRWFPKKKKNSEYDVTSLHRLANVEVKAWHFFTFIYVQYQRTFNENYLLMWFFTWSAALQFDEAEFKISVIINLVASLTFDLKCMCIRFLSTFALVCALWIWKSVESTHFISQWYDECTKADDTSQDKNELGDFMPTKRYFRERTKSWGTKF